MKKFFLLPGFAAFVFVGTAHAEIGCEGLLVKQPDNFFAAQIVCTNTEKPNLGYTCSGNWTLVDEDDKEHGWPHNAGTVPKNSVKLVKQEETRLDGKKINNQSPEGR